jgi:hypothetical protein
MNKQRIAIESSDIKFLCDLIEYLNNYKPKHPEQTIIKMEGNVKDMDATTQLIEDAALADELFTQEELEGFECDDALLDNLYGIDDDIDGYGYPEYTDSGEQRIE